MKRLKIFTIFIILLIVMTACSSVDSRLNQSVVIREFPDRYNPFYRETLVEIIDGMYLGSDEYVFVDNEGKDRTKDIIDNIEKPETDEEFVEFMEKYKDMDLLPVKKGEYRVSTMKKEIDGLFKGDREFIIVEWPGISDSLDGGQGWEFTENQFIEDNKEHYENGDYDKILDYLEEIEFYIIDMVKDD